MSTTRRRFICTTAAAAAATPGLFALGRSAAASAPAHPSDPAPADRKLRLLILGGTGFLGPHVVEAALARGHEMTLFNRGKTNPHLFPDLEKLRGDRDPDVDEGLKALEGRTWDAVVDTSGYYPRLVGASAGLLADAVTQYVFISSISVYADTSAPGLDETAPVGTMEDKTLEEMGAQFQYYGPLKALCEQAAERAMPSRATNIRPGLIVGPLDSTDRFTYWPVRVARGGEVLAPGDHDDPVQYIDARDLAEWIIHVIEQGTTGVFNATGPAAPTNIAELLYGCKAVTGGDVTFTWADADFLEANQVAPWAQMTVWIPPRGEYVGFHRVSVRRAVEAGLAFRPLAETVRDTLEWFESQPQERQQKMRAGLPAERETELLAAWHARRQPETQPETPSDE